MNMCMLRWSVSISAYIVNLRYKRDFFSRPRLIKFSKTNKTTSLVLEESRDQDPVSQGYVSVVRWHCTLLRRRVMSVA